MAAPQSDRQVMSGFTFTQEENEQLTRVGPGTLMGDLFRQYWIAVIPVSFLEEPGGKPLRVRLLCEDLVLFRTRQGKVGLVGAYCQHRLAPLYFGRIEEDGIRCPYHGWKYATDGKCMEMPNVPAEQQFCDSIHHPGYLCVERGGIIWTYMGPAKQPPPLPEFEFLTMPAEQRTYFVFHQECNYLQVLEGGIDPTHVMWLHSPYDLADDGVAKQHQPSQQLAANRSGMRTPMAIEIVDTAGGFMYGAKRPAGDGKELWRVNQFIMPFYSMPPGSDLRGARIYIPIDDENSIKWQISWFPTRELMEKSKADRKNFEEETYLPATHEPYSFIRPKATKENDYLINWEIHRSKRMGIIGVNLQDRCVTENEGPTPILDRSKEHLCSGDYSTIKARRMMLRAAHELREKGTPPPGIRDPKVYAVRGTSKVVSASTPWVQGVKSDVLLPGSTALA